MLRRILALLAVCAAVPGAPGATLFVNVYAGGAGTGDSWDDAYTSLTTALESALPGDDVWVATGLYRVSTTDAVAGGVSLLGGFYGGELSADERNPAEYPVYITAWDGPIEFDTSGSNPTRVDGLRFVLSPTHVLRFQSDALVQRCVFTRLNTITAPAPVELAGSGIAEFRNNLFAGCGGRAADTVAGQCGSLIFVNNTVVRNGYQGAESGTSEGGILNVQSDNATIANNVFAWNARLLVSGTAPDISSNVRWSTESDGGWNDLILDPLFVDDSAGRDYRLKGQSYAHGAGSSAYLVEDERDLDWQPRLTSDTISAGAYQYSGEPRLAFETQPLGGVDGGVLTTQPVLVVRDGDGNVDTGWSGEVTLDVLPGSGGGFAYLAGTTTVQLSAGRATFSDLELIGSVGRDHVLVGRCPGVRSAASEPFRSGLMRQYVSPSGNDANDGLSWATAKRTPGAAVYANYLRSSGVDLEIWLAAGTYPTRIYPEHGTAFFGGFMGTESTLDERPSTGYITILTPESAAGSIVATYGPWTTAFDRITFLGSGVAQYSGGAVSLQGPSQFEDCVFSGNKSGYSGGALYAGWSDYYRLITIDGCLFENNEAVLTGGAVALEDQGIQAVVSGNTFRHNRAGGRGGAVSVGYGYLDSHSAVLTANSFSDNAAAEGGALALYYADAVVADSTFSSNTALGTGAANPDGRGGAIYVIGGNRGAVLRNNTVADNAAEGFGGSPAGKGYGGGICIVDAYNASVVGGILSSNVATIGGNAHVESTFSPTVTRCTLSGGQAIESGANLSVFRSSQVEVSNCLIKEGQAGGSGAGILIDRSPRNDTYWSRVWIRNNTVVLNAGAGAAVSFTNHSKPDFANNIVASNSGAGGVTWDGTCEPVIRNNDVWGNASDYVVVPDQTGLNGNISADPRFVDSSAQDFTLQQDSPCLDAGDGRTDEYRTALDFAGGERARGVEVDMGAWERGTAPVLRLTVNYVPATPAGGAFGPQVLVLDRNNYIVPFSGPVTLNIAAGTGTNGAVLNGTTTVNMAGGIVNFSGLSIDRAGTRYRLLATAPGIAAGVSAEFSITGTGRVYLRPDGDNRRDGLTWEDAKRSLYEAQQQMPYSTPGEIWAAAGVYYGGTWLDRGVAVYGGFVGNETSLEQRDWRANETVLDAFGGDTVAQIITSDFDTRLDGLTLRGGNGYHGGIWAGWTGAGAPTIRNCVIRDNASAYGASGAHLASGLFAHNVVRGNSGRAAALVCGLSPGLQVVNNLVAENTNLDTREGAAVSVFSGGAGLAFVNNTIAANSGGEGEFFLEGAAALTNNIIRATANGVVFSQWSTPTATLKNNVVWAPSGQAYVPAAQDPGAADGNFKADPLFADAPGGNYRLAAGSPCIDAGFAAVSIPGNVDLDLLPRTFGGLIDLGAFEFAGVPNGFTLADVRAALRIAGGLTTAAPADVSRLDVAPRDAPDGTVTPGDAALLARKVGGKDSNP